MRSTFAGFNTATSGLFAAQRSLDVVGHNLSNVNTPGYTRQRMNQATARPLQLPGGKGPIGLGVEMVSVTQIRNEFLDIQYRKESVTLGYWETRYTFLDQIDATFNEPAGKSISTVMNNFYASMNELAKEAADPTKRQVMVQNAVALCENLNFMSGRFEKLIKDLNEEVEGTVRKINTCAEQIATLNKQIFETEVDGSHANDLRDKRNLVLDELSKLADIQVVNVPDVASNGKYSKMNVLIQGTGLVLHDATNTIALEKNEDHPLTIEGKTTDPKREDLNTVKVTNLKWSSGSFLNQKQLGGILGGQLGMRDNFEGDEKGIPYYARMLNEFASAYADEFNKEHSDTDGQDLNGNQGLHFFRPDGDPDMANTKRITAANIRVNKRIVDSPALIAAARALPNGAGLDNNENIDKLIAIRQKEDFQLLVKYDAAIVTKPDLLLAKGKPDDVFKSLVGALGVDGNEAKRKLDNQMTITESINGYRMSISSVSQDEEMSNMVKYQHAYNASARMITTIDEMIDVIINRMGRVGL